MIKLINADCLPAMKDMPDKAYDLAIVDPPFGIGKNWKKDTGSPFYRHKSSYQNNKIPSKKYFSELFRISRHQIIWGANYYWKYLSPTSNIIWWNKKIDPIKHLRSAGELAWTSVTKFPANMVTLTWNGCCTCEPRTGFHPHEKPVALYKWLLTNYAKQGDKILDTHGGSMSIAIACHDLGFDLDLYEIDKDYFQDGKERVESHQRQTMLFQPSQQMIVEVPG